MPPSPALRERRDRRRCGRSLRALRAPRAPPRAWRGARRRDHGPAMGTRGEAREASPPRARPCEPVVLLGDLADLGGIGALDSSRGENSASNSSFQRRAWTSGSIAKTTSRTRRKSMCSSNLLPRERRGPQPRPHRHVGETNDEERDRGGQEAVRVEQGQHRCIEPHERDCTDDPEEDDVRELVQLEEARLPQAEREAHVHQQKEAERVSLGDWRQHPEERRTDDAEHEEARAREDAYAEPSQRRACAGIAARTPPLDDRERDRQQHLEHDSARVSPSSDRARASSHRG